MQVTLWQDLSTARLGHFAMVSVSLPGTSSFIGEILASIGLFETNRLVVVSATINIDVLGAA